MWQLMCDFIPVHAIDRCLRYCFGINLVVFGYRRLVVVLEEEIHIFDFRRMSFVAKLRTPSNPYGQYTLTLVKCARKCELYQFPSH